MTVISGRRRKGCDQTQDTSVDLTERTGLVEQVNVADACDPNVLGEHLAHQLGAVDQHDADRPPSGRSFPGPQ